VAETRAAVDDHGARAVMIRPNPVMGRPLHHRDHDRFFSLIEDLDVPLVIHEGRGGQADFAGDRFDTWYASHAVSHPFEMMLAFTSLAVEGVFDRHPRLRVGLLEAGTGWLTWWLHRLDEHHAMFGSKERAGLRRRPSEYFAEHCIISSDSDDDFVRQTIDTVGADHVTWSSDFPHLEAKWPNGVEEFLGHAGLDIPTAQQVLWETPCRFYAIDPNRPIKGARS
jgi:uncharacterized protein